MDPFEAAPEQLLLGAAVETLAHITERYPGSTYQVIGVVTLTLLLDDDGHLTTHSHTLVPVE